MKKLAPVFGLVVVSTVIVGTQDVGAQQPNCANPTPQDCNSPAFLKACPKPSDAARTTCENVHKAAFATYFNGLTGAKPDKVFEHAKDRFTPGKRIKAPTVTKQGSYSHPRASVPKSPFRNDTTTWHGQENRAHHEAQSTNKTPAQFMRSGISPGDEILNCEDYVYKSYWDQERWADAIYACKDDVRCEADVSLTSTSPGLANRQMMSKDNPPRPIADPDNLMGARSGYLPRNDFYDMTGIFIPNSLVQAFAGDPAKLQSMQKLVAAVKTGFMDYYLGPGVAGGSPVNATTQGFSGEWDFDAVMNVRTHGNVDGEFYEYARRNKGVISDILNFGEYLKQGEPPPNYNIPPNQPTHATAGPNVPNAVGGLGATRLYTFTDDAFLTRQVLAGIDASHMMNQGAVVQKYPQIAQAIAAHKDIATGLAYAGSTLPGVVDPNGGKQIPFNGLQSFNNQPSPFEGLFSKHPPPIDTKVKYPRLVCPNIPDLLSVMNENNPSRTQTFYTAKQNAVLTEKFYGDPLLCELINRVLEEWHRHEANLGSCFDTGMYACDWSPRDFVKRWKRSLLGLFDRQKERDYAECKSWEAQIFKGKNGFAAGPTKKPRPWTNDPGTVTDARKRLCEEETALQNELKGVPLKDPDVFGEEHVDQQTYGDDDFNVNYHYDYGWDTRIFARYSDKKPCEFGGRMYGEFDAGATAFGNGIKVFDANFDLDVNDDGNQNGSKVGTPTRKVLVDGKGEFLGEYTIYDLTSDHLSWALNQSKSLPVIPDSNNKQLVVAVPIPIGPIDVTLSIYIGWSYGVQAGLKGEATTCKAGEADPHPSSPASLGLFGHLVPSGEVDLDASVDVSVLGFGAGVECDLTLIGVDLPLRADTKVALNKNNKAALTFDLGLDAKLHTLDGVFSVYVTVPIFGQVASWEIGSWRGLTYEFDLLHASSPPIELDFLQNPVKPNGLNPSVGACCDPRTSKCS